MPEMKKNKEMQFEFMQNITAKHKNVVKGRLGLVIDSTARDVKKF